MAMGYDTLPFCIVLIPAGSAFQRASASVSRCGLYPELVGGSIDTRLCTVLVWKCLLGNAQSLIRRF